MRKVILYIAVSLDGFIADRQGGVDWLEQASKGEEDSGYDEFIQKVDTVLMGYKTYVRQLDGPTREESLGVRRGRAGPPGCRGRPNRPDSFDHPACPAGGRNPLVRRAGGEYLPASD